MWTCLERIVRVAHERAQWCTNKPIVSQLSGLGRVALGSAPGIVSSSSGPQRDQDRMPVSTTQLV